MDATHEPYFDRAFLSAATITQRFNTMESRQLNGALTNDDTQAPMLLGITGGFLLLSILLLLARLWSRIRPISNLKADDWTVLAGTVSSTASNHHEHLN